MELNMGTVETTLGEVTFLTSLCFLQGMFFISASYVQLNDPDPYLWIPVYGITALICFLFFVRFVIFACKEGLKDGDAKISLAEWLMMDRLMVAHSAYCWCLGALTLVKIGLAFVHTEERLFWLDDLTKEKGMAWEEVKEIGGVCVTLAWLFGLQKHRFLRQRKLKGLGVALVIVVGPIIGWSLAF